MITISRSVALADDEISLVRHSRQEQGGSM